MSGESFLFVGWLCSAICYRKGKLTETQDVQKAKQMQYFKREKLDLVAQAFKPQHL